MAFSFSEPYYTFLGIQTCINAIAVLGINIISGYTRQIHLGQAAFIGIGAYTSAIVMCRLGWSFWIACPLSILVSFAMGVLLGIPTLKLRGGPYLAMVTQIFGEIVFIVLLNWVDLTGGPFGISKIPSPEIGSFSFRDPSRLLALCIVFLLLAYAIAKRIVASKYGRFFLAIRESEAGAQSIGVNISWYKIVAFGISSALGGLAGSLYGPMLGYLSPDQFRAQFSLNLISMAIIGGIASLEGGILGATLLTLLPELLRSASSSASELRLILYGLLLIFFLAFLPNGIISLLSKWPKLLAKRMQKKPRPQEE